MTTSARLPIAADRAGPCVRTVVFNGLDLTGVDQHLQVRLGPDTPGAPLINLGLVNDPGAEGLHLTSVVVTDGLPVSTMQLRILGTTMQDLTRVPYAGEIGDAWTGSYGWVATIAGDQATLVAGTFSAVPTTFGSDNAPVNRPGFAMSGASAIAGAWSTASLTFGPSVTTVTVDGAALISPLVAVATAARDATLASSTTAVAKAIEASQYAAAASALANRFLTYAAGMAGTVAGQDFTVVDPAGQWVNVYRNGTSDANTPLIQLPGKAAYAAPAGALMIGTAKGALQVVLDALPRYATVWGVKGDGVVDDTAAAQAFINACAAGGSRVAYFGTLVVKVSGPLTSNGVGIVFEPFSYGGGGAPGFYATGAGYTVLTVTGSVADFACTVYGNPNGVATLAADGTVTADTRTQVDGIAFGAQDGSAPFVLSTVRSTRVYQLNGFGARYTTSWDNVFVNTSIEQCGGANYAFDVVANAGGTGNTCNESTWLRAQIESPVSRAMKVDPDTLSCNFNKIHSERAHGKVGVATWQLGGAGTEYHAVRLTSDAPANCSGAVIGQGVMMSTLRAEDGIPVSFDATGGSMTLIEPAGYLVAAANQTGTISVRGGLVFATIGSRWTFDGTAIFGLRVGFMSAGERSVVKGCNVTDIQIVAGTNSGTLDIDDCTVTSSNPAGFREINLLGRTKWIGDFGLAYQSCFFDESSVIIGNVTTNSAGFVMNGQVQGNVTFQSPRQNLVGSTAFATGVVTGDGAPDGGGYLPLYNGMKSYALAPAVGSPWVWVRAAGAWHGVNL